MQKILYQLFIRFYPVMAQLAAPFNKKARLFTNGRKGIFEKLRSAISDDDMIIWMHCASLGEFEQGRPLLEKLKASYPSYKILLTFFSPSGYEVRKNYTEADYVFYLPIDGWRNASLFYEIVRPRLIVFVKYEFWHYYLQMAKTLHIPLLLVSAIFRKDQQFFKKSGKFYRNILSNFTHFFVQNQESEDLLQSIGFKKNVSVSGDTRFDRVIEIAENAEPIAEMEKFCSGSDVIVAGSTWPDDDKVLCKFTNSKQNLKYIIAPHSVHQQRLSECMKLYKNAALFSSLSAGNIPAGVTTIIIDNVGMLASLYNYATITYVGGGFGKDGIHNVLEAAVYGKPVVFGRVYDRYAEAVDLVKNGGATSVSDAASLETAFIRLLKKDREFIDSCNAAKTYVYSKRGATAKILAFIQENRLLTS